jgi:hypothetical protein
MDCAAERSVRVSSSSIGEKMNTTASSFTLRKNAKRAAEAIIRNGTAPAVDYDINPSGNGRFEIVWQQLFETGRALPAGFAGAARCFGGRPMSKGGALVRLHDCRTARDHKAATRHFWRCRCIGLVTVPVSLG